MYLFSNVVITREYDIEDYICSKISCINGFMYGYVFSLVMMYVIIIHKPIAIELLLFELQQRKICKSMIIGVHMLVNNKFIKSQLNKEIPDLQF